MPSTECEVTVLAQRPGDRALWEGKRRADTPRASGKRGLCELSAADSYRRSYSAPRPALTSMCHLHSCWETSCMCIWDEVDEVLECSCRWKSWLQICMQKETITKEQTQQNSGKHVFWQRSSSWLQTCVARSQTRDTMAWERNCAISVFILEVLTWSLCFN